MGTSDEGPSDPGRPRVRRVPRPMTPNRLRNIAVHYLERRTTTRGHLRRLLMNRVRRSLAHHDGDEDVMASWVDALLDDLERLRWIDDRAWATSRLATLARRGLSERAIRAKLSQKCVSRELVDELLAEAAVDPLRGAARFAHKRRIGPFRERDRADHRDRDLGRLARGGHSYGVARQVLDLEPDDAIDLVLGARDG